MFLEGRFWSSPPEPAPPSFLISFSTSTHQWMLLSLLQKYICPQVLFTTSPATNRGSTPAHLSSVWLYNPPPFSFYSFKPRHSYSCDFVRVRHFSTQSLLWTSNLTWFQIRNLYDDTQALASIVISLPSFPTGPLIAPSLPLWPQTFALAFVPGWPCPQYSQVLLLQLQIFIQIPTPQRDIS